MCLLYGCHTKDPSQQPLADAQAALGLAHEDVYVLDAAALEWRRIVNQFCCSQRRLRVKLGGYVLESSTNVARLVGVAIAASARYAVIDECGQMKSGYCSVMSELCGTLLANCSWKILVGKVIQRNFLDEKRQEGLPVMS